MRIKAQCNVCIYAWLLCRIVVIAVPEQINPILQIMLYYSQKVYRVGQKSKLLYCRLEVVS